MVVKAEGACCECAPDFTEGITAEEPPPTVIYFSWVSHLRLTTLATIMGEYSSWKCQRCWFHWFDVHLLCEFRNIEKAADIFTTIFFTSPEIGLSLPLLMYVESLTTTSASALQRALCLTFSFTWPGILWASILKCYWVCDMGEWICWARDMDEEKHLRWFLISACHFFFLSILVCGLQLFISHECPNSVQQVS